MKILMISNDRGLLGQQRSGDVVRRHQEYAKHVERLDILVLVKFKKPEANALAPNSMAVPLRYWRMEKAAAVQYEKEKYDLVVCQDPFITGSLGVWLKEEYKCKLVMHFHGDFFDNPYWLKEMRRNRYYKKMAEENIIHADSIRVVSEAIRPKLMERHIKREDIYVIPTPVDLEQFRTQPTVGKRNKQVILTVGRIVKAKDFPTLLRAAQEVITQHPNLEWRIIGDGPLKDKFERQTKEIESIKWLGAVDHKKLREQYAQATALVLTSTNESFGKVFLEAAMAQVPSIATRTLGAQEIIQDGQTGFLAPIGDGHRIAERVNYVLNQPDVAEQLGAQAQIDVLERFGWEKSVTGILEMWRQTVGRG